MATKTATTLTQEQKSQALTNARKSLAARRKYAQKARKNSFDEWGNDKCISRLIDTIDQMERGYASERQYRYWFNH
jgi:hypothetical protein